MKLNNYSDVVQSSWVKNIKDKWNYGYSVEKYFSFNKFNINFDPINIKALFFFYFIFKIQFLLFIYFNRSNDKNLIEKKWIKNMMTWIEFKR